MVFGISGEGKEAPLFLFYCFVFPKRGTGTLLPRSARLRSRSSPLKANTAAKASVKANGKPVRNVPAPRHRLAPAARAGMRGVRGRDPIYPSVPLPPVRVRAPQSPHDALFPYATV